MFPLCLHAESLNNTENVLNTVQLFSVAAKLALGG